MKKDRSIFVLLIITLGTVTPMGRPEDRAPHVLTRKDQDNHLGLLREMNSEQVKTLSNIYPDFSILNA